jgi:hypothetical protein
MMNRISVVLGSLLLQAHLSAIVLGADHDADLAVSALRATNNFKWVSSSVRVKDPEGNPVVGAVVRPWELRGTGKSTLWRDEAHGAAKKVLTDAEGLAMVDCPAIFSEFDRDNVERVSIVISHPDFCSKTLELEVRNADPIVVPEISLERGEVLRVAGVVPGTKQPLSDCHLLIEDNEIGEADYVVEANGWLRSFPIQKHRRWFRVVRTPPGKPIEFSKPLAWDPDDPSSRTVFAEIRPGVRVKGKVSDDVPRPIKRGHVLAWCGSTARNEAVKGAPIARKQPIWWTEWTEIKEDGSFEFPSLPAGYLAQVYAIANDWISAQPTDEALDACKKWFLKSDVQLEGFYRYGQVLRLAGAESSMTIEMEQAGQVKVKCIDPKGTPLRRVFLSSWPNQQTVSGGATVFCIRSSTKESIIDRRRKINWEKVNPFTAETDDNGEAIIHSLPEGKQLVFASNNNWISKQHAEAEITLDKPAEVTMTLEPRSE